KRRKRPIIRKCLFLSPGFSGLRQQRKHLIRAESFIYEIKLRDSVSMDRAAEHVHTSLVTTVHFVFLGLPENHKVQTPAFTDTIRLYRQAQGHFGTWEMLCGVPSQILSNLVMESLLPELRELISPRLKGKLHERQRNWMLITDAVYSMVQSQCQTQYEAAVHKCEAARSSLEASIRTDMDQIITSKEHVTNKIKAVVLPKAEKLLKVSIQPYISSILDALMEPTSRGFFEVRDVFFRELVDMSKNTLNSGTKEHMDKISMLAFHPVKMQSCYEKVELLSLEGLQQRFDVSSPSVFVQRAQILMRKQMDDAVYTFEQILYQSLESQGTEDLCKTIQRCQDRVIKKFDYDSSTVRKRFFREALLQIFIPYMLKQLGPSCASELPRFRELIFEDFSRFILVENIYEEVVLHSVMKDIMMAVKEAAVQRRHNLYRDSIVLSNSDPSLHLLGENPSIDWAEKYGGTQGEGEEPQEVSGVDGEPQKRRRVKQVVSMIQVEGSGELFKEPPSIDVIQEEADGTGEEKADGKASFDSLGIGDPVCSESPPDTSNGSALKGEEANPEELSRETGLVKVESAVEGASGDVEEKKGENPQPVIEEELSPNKESEELPPPCPEEVLPGRSEAIPEKPSDLSSDVVLEEEEANADLVKENSALSNPTVDGVSVAKEELKEVCKAGVKEEALCNHKNEEEGLPLLPPSDETPSEATQTTPENPPEVSNDSSLKEGEAKADDPEVQEVQLKAEPAGEGPSVNIQGEGKREDNQPVSEELPAINQQESDETVPVTAQPAESTPDNPVLIHNDSGFQSPTSEVTATSDPQA
uniref:Niban apoptosis regulator 2b n=1 Tax=Fundulus heteroclitus TaxID=8078 RepID=A0A3Q2P4H7_FUNHE